MVALVRKVPLSPYSRTSPIPLAQRCSIDPCVLCGIGKCSLGIRLTVARKGMGKAASSDPRPPFLSRLLRSSAFQLRPVFFHFALLFRFRYLLF